jgi:cytidine deaminase
VSSAIDGGRGRPPGDVDLDALRTAAFEALERAYAPYSGFRVGCALVGADGSVHPGCNVENAAYPSGVCAERGALLGAVVRGTRAFDLLVLATEAEEPATPCGQCRQMLVEFNPALPVVSYTRGGKVGRWTLAELLPHPFTPMSLHHR